MLNSHQKTFLFFECYLDTYMSLSNNGITMVFLKVFEYIVYIHETNCRSHDAISNESLKIHVNY